MRAGIDMGCRRERLKIWKQLGCLLLSLFCISGTAETVTYVYSDNQGTPIAEADAQGSITAVFGYTPYGRSTGVAPEGLGYTGHVNDPDTGLVYMQARYYDPATGRFLSADPVTPSPGNLFSFNRYDYANNNPIVNIDPDGRQSTMGAGIWVGEATMANQSPKQVQRLNEINAAQAKLTVSGMAAPAGGEAIGLVKVGVAIYKALSDSPKTEVVQRAMSKAELKATQDTGLLRGGRSGTHHASDAVNSSAGRAQQRLALPIKPEVRVTLKVPEGRFSAPTRVEPNFNMPGGGMERTASGEVPVTIIRTDKMPR